MKRAAEACTEAEPFLERIHCSSDPDSLDGVIFHRGRASIVDATPPHVIEPGYPGGFETVVNLCDYFDEEKLEHRLEEIAALQAANQECHRKCRGLLRGAELLRQENFRFAERHLHLEKIRAFAARVVKNELGESSGPAREDRRLLSAVTNQGVLTYAQTAQAICTRLFVIQDEFGAAANALLQRIRLEALEKGHWVISCYCPLAPESQLEHLFFPGLRFGIVTRNRLHPFEGIKAAKIIHFTRFTAMEELKRRKQCMSFHRKAAAGLLDAAAETLRQAKRIHDQLEEQYLDAVDFSRVEAKTVEVLEKLKRRYPPAEQ